VAESRREQGDAGRAQGGAHAQEQQRRAEEEDQGPIPPWLTFGSLFRSCFRSYLAVEQLNVGGTPFEVRRKVLCDAVPESHLAELFSGRWESKILTDKSGMPFLDVNPECFSAIVKFLKARLKDGQHAEIPVVADELVPTLHRLLDHFGLGHIFVAAEGEAAPADMEPEPEDEGEEQEEEGVPPAEVAAPPAMVQEREHRAAENEQVELPARTIDHILSARYGSLDEPGKWIDVTRMLVDMVDEEGGLTLTASSSGFGADPAPDTEKQLSIRYSSLPLI
jgi:hypothetical protein